MRRIRIRRKAAGFLLVAGMVAAMSSTAMAYQGMDEGTSSSQQTTKSAGCQLPARLRYAEPELCPSGPVLNPAVTHVQYKGIQAPESVPSSDFNFQWVAVAVGAIALIGIALLSVRLRPSHAGGHHWF